MDSTALKHRLKKSEKVVLSNASYQESIGDDDVREAELTLVRDDRRPWRNGFYIEFNGQTIHHSKGWDSFNKRLEKLIKTWNLKEVQEVS